MSHEKNGGSLNRSLNKLLVTLVTFLACTAVTGNVFGDYCNSNDCDPCCSKVINKNCCSLPDYTLYVDFLYWQVHPEGTDFARYEGFAPSEDSDIEDYGEIIAPNCELEPGFRVGIQIDLGCCDWDLYVQYTWLNQWFDVTKDAPMSSQSLQPLIWNIGNSLNLTHAKGEWDTNYNVLDFGLGYTFDVNCCFEFRPHFGFKATMQNHCFSVTYNSELSDSITNQDKLKFKSDFTGIGLRGGFDAAWKFDKYISLVGGLALSTVYSNQSNQRQDNHSDNIFSTPYVQNLDLDQDICVLMPVLELLFGLQLNRRVSDCYDVFVFIGWENQIWWNANNFIHVGPDTENLCAYNFGPNNALTLQGLTVRAGFGF